MASRLLKAAFMSTACVIIWRSGCCLWDATIMLTLLSARLSMYLSFTVDSCIMLPAAAARLINFVLWSYMVALPYFNSSNWRTLLNISDLKCSRSASLIRG